MVDISNDSVIMFCYQMKFKELNSGDLIKFKNPQGFIIESNNESIELEPDELLLFLNIEPNHVEKLIKQESLNYDPNVSVETLNLLANDQYDYVRRSVALNPNVEVAGRYKFYYLKRRIVLFQSFCHETEYELEIVS